ncbi:hypothetical protein Mal64_15300 [Pseudobythopirellula maris]|uniref:Flagellar protein FliL n=1 Tax=Pseudobythopirellula maris TaxID=2527991 RepID=A0A5C5ZVX9_9BACT|nr:hypothetical protein [Pseudobythopirellula maris]TWT91131.1 hypothetical protein Mal64_15300 [Pseudobythopirellula maris]
MMTPVRTLPTRRPPARRAIVAVLCAVAAAGCYDPTTLVERIRTNATRNRLEEIPLGTFAAVLPRDIETGEILEVELSIYGEAARYRVAELKSELEAKEYLIRDEFSKRLRLIDRSVLTDPHLNQVREELHQIVNDTLDEPLIDTVGVSNVLFLRH